MAETGRPFGLLLADDLLFTSRITGTARALDLDLKIAPTPAMLEALAREHAPTCVLLDLSLAGHGIADLVANLRTVSRGVLVVTYGSHVDTATLQAARAAGCDLVLPRSRFVEELPRQLSAWFMGKPLSSPS